MADVPGGIATDPELPLVLASVPAPSLRTARIVASCSLAIVLALYVVGIVSHTSLRHVVQTAPLWFPVIEGFRGRELAKWAALPCFFFWMFIMVAIWLYLLGVARVVSGHFTPIEVAMTLIIGAACIIGTAAALRWRTRVKIVSATSFLLLFTVLQIFAMRISFMPEIATR